MSPTSYQLLYPAMLDYKGRNIFLKCKTYFKKCSDLNHSVGSLLLKFW